MKRLLLPVLMVLLGTGTAAARDRLVPTQYPTIQAAVNASAAGDVVLIAAGTYDDCVHPASPTDTTKCVVVMKSGVSLRGEGTGATVIDARHLGRGIECNGVINSTIESLTVKRAFAATYGAGIYCVNGSSPAIRDCVVRDGLDGGIIVRAGSSPSISWVTITNNAAKEGGGLAVDLNSNPVVTSCFITNNQAPSGGGVFIRGGSTPQITNSIIKDNFINLANGDGGGFTISAANPVITNCVIENNSATGSGGGMAMSEAVVLISLCQIVGNHTTGTYGPGGGVFIGYNSDATFEDCLIARNTIVGTDLYSDGGGVRAFVALGVTLRRCTIAANSAAGALGGGVSAGICFPVIEKSIIADNGPGAALYCDDAPSGAFTVSCTDLFGNTGGNAICGTDGGNNFNLDPRFCDLANGQFYLQGTSPCLPGQHPNGPTACGGSRIGALGTGCGSLDVPEVSAGLSMQARPNPFRGATEIRFDLARAGQVGVVIYDAAGREVRSLVQGSLAAGSHALAWDGLDAAGRRVADGVYFSRLSVDGKTAGRQVLVAR